MVTTRSQISSSSRSSSGKGKSGKGKGPSKQPPPQPRNSSILHLRIRASSVLVYANDVAPISSGADVAQAYATSPPNPAQQYLGLLEGELSDFQYFAGGECSQWLIDVAHGLCDPRHKIGQLWVRNRNGQDSLVNPNDPLGALTYEYRVAAPIHLTKISDRQHKSVTSRTGLPQTMRTRVLARDGGRDWISRVTDRRGMVNKFTNMPFPAGLSIYDPIFGICLISTLDNYFDMFEVALKPTNGKYVAHDFSVSPPNPSSTTNPPAGLFWWHYLQCVIVKFGCLDYRGQDNILHYEKLMRTEDDLDDDNDDDDNDFSWPTALFDRGRMLTQNLEQKMVKEALLAGWVNKQ
ncbi:hypothetical protein BT96DRAFT_1007713 [Gymnopus androsaceus JB14]|uniref:Uncharacterized protein n=1 Tax=Gymnopus androsaceus JB14 TaxID=1447944 RepID=A0A6A4GHG6_9AGAR|nr:hypothetical protein BT96DRAFT_1007713 [Gymnopus androsaceus JB14]